MLNGAIIGLRDFILSKNEYFTQGFDAVYQDAEAGIVTSDEEVFPNDRLGNYFYLRLPDNVTFTTNSTVALSECENGLSESANIILVAIVRNADPDILLKNLYSSVNTYGSYVKTFNTAIYRKEIVVRQELSFLIDANRSAALQRIPKEMTIVSLSFSLTELLPIQNCIVDPCTIC